MLDCCSGVTVSVSVLLAAGTAFDIFRERKYRKVYKSQISFTENYLRSETTKVGLEDILSNRSKSMKQHGGKIIFGFEKRQRKINSFWRLFNDFIEINLVWISDLNVSDGLGKLDDNSNAVDVIEGSSITSNMDSGSLPDIEKLSSHHLTV